MLDRRIPHTDIPRCVECGECFTNWDRILVDLKEHTATQVEQAERVKVTGVTGRYKTSFEDMEEKLMEVKTILTSASISNEELVGMCTHALHT